MTEKVTGGCQCGAVRYRIDQALENAHICHCRMCQKASGNYFMPLARAPKAKFKVTRGEIGWFHSSDLVRRGFCRECGTPLVFEVVERDSVNIVLGDLDSVEPATDETAWYAAIAPSNHQHPDHDTEEWPPAESRT